MTALIESVAHSPHVVIVRVSHSSSRCCERADAAAPLAVFSNFALRRNPGKSHAPAARALGPVVEAG
jgi:hypothetical protein